MPHLGYLGLVELCAAAHELGFEIDPDGLGEDRHEIIQDKLKTSCSGLMCGEYLVEIKCLSLKRNFRAAIVLIMNGIVARDSEGSFSTKPTHAYYFQMQGQMTITGIHWCVSFGGLTH